MSLGRIGKGAVLDAACRALAVSTAELGACGDALRLSIDTDETNAAEHYELRGIEWLMPLSRHTLHEHVAQVVAAYDVAEVPSAFEQARQRRILAELHARLANSERARAQARAESQRLRERIRHHLDTLAASA